MSNDAPRNLWSECMAQALGSKSDERGVDESVDRLGPGWRGFRRLHPTFESAAEPPTCSLDCDHCSEQYLPKHPLYFREIELHDDGRANSEIKTLLSNNKENLAYISQQVERHGSVIVNRWTKRFNDAKRGTLLRQAKPNIPSRKHTIAEFLHGCSGFDLDKPIATFPKLLDHMRQPFREFALTPYLNIPSLLGDKLKLLALIHYRVTHSPSEWMLFDWHQAKIVWYYMGLATIFNPHCVVLHGPKFGELVPWDKDAAHQRQMIGYPAAHLALKAQNELTRFLRNMVDLILEGDLSATVDGREEWNLLAAHGFTEQSVDRPVSAYYETAFRPPPQFDAAHLLNLFESRVRAAEDDLRLKQTNPLHFQDFANRTIASVQLYAKESQFSKSFVLNLMLRSLAQLPLLRWIVRKLNDLNETARQFRVDKMSTSILPDEYWATLRFLEHILKGTLHSEIGNLGVMIASSAAFRGHCAQNEVSGFRIVTPDADLLKSAIKYHRNYEASIVFDPPTDINYPSSIGEYSALSQKVLVEFAKDNDRLWRRLEHVRKLPKPTSQITEQSVEQDKCLHQALDDFWKEVHDVLLPELEADRIPLEVCNEFVEDVSVGLDEDFRARLRKQWEDALHSLQSRKSQLAISTYPGPLFTGRSPFSMPPCATNENSVVQPTIVKVKVKTRPQQQLAEEESDHNSDEMNALALTTSTEKIALDRQDSLTVFTHMFATSGIQHGPTKWPRFVAALKDAGLSATFNGGSRVMFSDDRSHKGAVSFHKPHPDSDIHPNMLRDMGDSLTRWFGWDDETFFVRPKKGK